MIVVHGGNYANLIDDVLSDRFKPMFEGSPWNTTDLEL
jgi:hypothetical protein